MFEGYNIYQHYTNSNLFYVERDGVMIQLKFDLSNDDPELKSQVLEIPAADDL